MKKLIISILIIFIVSNLFAQDKALDSLKIQLNKETSDTGRVKLLIDIGGKFGFGQAKNDSSLWYLQQALNLSKKMKYVKGEINARYLITSFLTSTGNYPEALKMALYNLKMAKQYQRKKILFLQTRQAGWIYAFIRDYKKELEYEKQLSSLLHSGIYKDTTEIKLYNMIANNCISAAYSDLKMPDSALYYEGLIYKFSIKNKNPKWLALSTTGLGDLYFNKGNYDSAFFFYKTSHPYAVKLGRRDLVTADALGIARLFNKKNRPDSAFFYARQSLKVVQTTNDPYDLLHVYSLLSKLYQKVHRYDSAYLYLQNFVNLKDSLFNQNKIAKAQNFAFNETLRQQQIIQAQKEARQLYKNKLKVYILIAVILVFLIIAILLLRNVRNKRKANIILGKQKEEIQNTLSELKATQDQLIHSEKMASLGELTAGIAHEIQNPLNFVNNFSEVSTELLEEMKENIKNGNLNEVKDLLEDVMQNLEKIHTHGGRADGIVKSMLQHSRGSSGQKELTDISALCDEYLRLSYHGLRAKDKSFNADFKLEADQSLPKVEVVPQDIGRVLLNLINNAFYAVSEKAKQNPDGYKPSVIVSTKNQGNTIEISVKDNGAGIPDSVKKKIFQPFFTTKPTGQGTGLGLSLSYDIVKAHGGELKVETEVGKGTVFIVELLKA